MERIGTASVHFNLLTDPLAWAISRHGYGLAQPEDEERFREALRQDGLAPSPPRVPPPEKTGPKPRSRRP